MRQIKFTINSVPQSKQRVIPVTKDRAGNPLAKGHSITPEETRSATRDAWAHAYNKRPPGPLWEGPVALLLIIYIPWTRKAKKSCKPLQGGDRPVDSDPITGPWPRENKTDWGEDADNLGKLYSDAFNKTLYLDDRQVVDFHAIKRFSDKPRIEVQVTYIDADSKDIAGHTKKKPVKPGREETHG
jgi:Holliday junction resolvase RusA-like endonuclease